MKKKLLVAIPLLSTIMFSGCATLFGGGGKQTISISTDSQKRLRAIVSYDDGSKPQYLILPGTVTMDRKNSNIVVKSQDNEFNPVIVEKNLNGWFWVNSLAGYSSLFSSTTDATTGAMWKYDDTVTVHEKY